MAAGSASPPLEVVMTSGAPLPGLTVRPLEPADAEAIAAWRYDGPWDVYDSHPDDRLSAEAGYQAVVDGAGDLVGFLCLGQEARVPGLAETDGLVDLGAGMRPDLVGRGLGRAFGAAVMSHVARSCGEIRLRAVVQSWNQRSLRLAQVLGFRETGTHRCVQGGREVSYTVLEGAARPAVTGSQQASGPRDFDSLPYRGQ
jgi:[ribosomal protein S18]-alanine N-acetyltransferase